MNTERTDGSTRTDQRASRSVAARTAIDIDEVADRVYRLMLAEVRLERARGARVARARGER